MKLTSYRPPDKCRRLYANSMLFVYGNVWVRVNVSKLYISHIFIASITYSPPTFMKHRVRTRECEAKMRIGPENNSDFRLVLGWGEMCVDKTWPNCCRTLVIMPANDIFNSIRPAWDPIPTSNLLFKHSSQHSMHNAHIHSYWKMHQICMWRE